MSDSYRFTDRWHPVRRAGLNQRRRPEPAPTDAQRELAAAFRDGKLSFSQFREAIRQLRQPRPSL